MKIIFNMVHIIKNFEFKILQYIRKYLVNTNNNKMKQFLKFI